MELPKDMKNYGFASIAPLANREPFKQNEFKKVMKGKITIKKYTPNLSKYTKKKDVVDIVLLDSQIECVKANIKTLESNPWAMNSSKMGAGKTVMTAYIQQHFKFPYMIVVCPASLEENWKLEASKYGLPLTMILTYEALAGKKEGTLAHGLLEAEKGTRMMYNVSTMFKDMCKKGVFVVFDEMQKLKNTTNNQEASAALIKYINIESELSRVIYLSGSPFDKEEQIVGFLRYNSIIKHRNMYIKDEYGNITYKGLQDLIEYCNKLDNVETDYIKSDQHYAYINNKSLAQKFAAKLYYDVIQPHMTSAAPVPKNIHKLDATNAYFNMTKGGELNLKLAIESLRNSAGFNEYGHITPGVVNLGAIVNALVAIEHAKIEIFERYAKNILQENPTAKVCIMVNYKEAVNCLKLSLGAYNPLIMDGSVPKGKRGEIISKFQEYNTNHRVIISNIVVTSTGLNLDDTHGNFPRYFLISPGYNAMILHQATFRGLRPYTKSVPHVRYVFGKCGVIENRILDALQRKRDVMKSSVKKQISFDSSFKFPGEYENWTEEDPFQGNDTQ